MEKIKVENSQFNGGSIRQTEPSFLKLLAAELLSHLLEENNLQKICCAIVDNINKSHCYEKDTNEQLLPVKETCKFLDISRGTLYNQIKSNPYFPKPKRLGKRVLFSRSSLIEYLNKYSHPHVPP